MVNFDQHVPAFKDSLSSEMKLQGAGDQCMEQCPTGTVHHGNMEKGVYQNTW